MSTWRFDALAGAALEAASGSVPLERKAAALLLILYRSGPTPRSRLAGMLWPGSPEGTARNNLAQALRRLHFATGAEIVVGDARLELVPDLRCDLAASVGDDALDVLGSRALLAAHDYDDCAELAEWLELERQRLLRRHLAHLHDEAEGLEAMGNARAALRAYERIVADALCLVRCAVVAGDAAAARTAWLAAERAGATVTSQLVHTDLRRVRGLMGTPDGDARRARQQRSFRAWLRRGAGRVPVAYRDRYLGLAQRPTRDPGTI